VRIGQITAVGRATIGLLKMQAAVLLRDGRVLGVRLAGSLWTFTGNMGTARSASFSRVIFGRMGILA
jgi:hypothetical protein